MISRDAAERFVDALFTNGAGFQGERLVLTGANGEDYGGWCRQAVVDRVRELVPAVLVDLERRLQVLETELQALRAREVALLAVTGAQRLVIGLTNTWHMTRSTVDRERLSKALNFLSAKRTAAGLPAEDVS